MRWPGSSRGLTERLSTWLPQLASGAQDATATLFTEDAVLRIPGRSEVAGVYKGQAAITALFETLSDLSDGTFALALVDADVKRWSGQARVRMTATRNQKKLDVEESLRFEVVRGRVKDATIVLLDRRVHDTFWSTDHPPLFSREDREALVSAFSNSGGGDHGGGSLLLVLMLALVSAWVLLLALRTVQHRRAAIDLTVTSQRALDTRYLRLSGQGTSWTMSTAAADRVAFAPPQYGWTDVVLPLKAGQACRALSLRPTASCASGGPVVGTPLSIEWSSPILVSTTGTQPYDEDQLQVTLGQADGSTTVTLLSSGRDAPGLCFTALAGTKVTIRRGLEVADVITLTKADGNMTCSDGFHVRVVGGNSPDHLATVTLGGVQTLELEASGRSAVLQGLNGRLILDPGGPQVVASTGQVTLESAADQLRLALSLSPTVGSLHIHSASVNNLLTDDGELAPSVWDRYAPFLGPIFAGLVGVAVLAPLTVVVRRATDWISRWSIRRSLRRIAASLRLGR